MAPKIGHRELLSIHQDRLDYYQSNINELTTNMLRNPLKSHLDMAGFDIKNARRIQTLNSLHVGTSINVGNSITINQNIALGGNITDLDGNILSFGTGSGNYDTIQNSPGFLKNDGSGSLSYTDISIRDLSDVISFNYDTLQTGAVLGWDGSGGNWIAVPLVDTIVSAVTDATQEFINNSDFGENGIMIRDSSGSYGIIENPTQPGFLKSDGSGGFIYENIVSGGGGSSNLTINNRGQTFAQLLTEQPNKFNQDGEPDCKSDEIIINWNYEDIIPTDENIRKFAQGSSIKSRRLPYINEIKIEIYGTVTGPHAYQSNIWLDYRTLSIQSSEDYNTTNSLKTITFTKTDPTNADDSAIDNILSKTDPFFVRIFGCNDNLNDFPTIDIRALEINRSDASGVAFLEAAAPSQPLFQRNENKFSDSNYYYLTSIFKVQQTELGVINSGAVLNNYITSFDEEDDDSDRSLRSEYFSLIQQSNTISGILANVQSDTEFEIKIGDNNLRAGTKYKYTVTVTNNISTERSAASAQQLSPYTRLPTSSQGTSLTLTSDTQLTYVTSSTFTNNIIYLNTNISGKTQFNVHNTTNQSFEITKPYTLSQETTTEGFGRFVDNVIGLVSISLKIDNASKETITFNGFDQNSGNEGTLSQSGTTYFGNATIQDMYSDDNNKGFRLLGTLSLKNINNIYTKIGPARELPYLLQYDYQRDPIVASGQNPGPEYKVYIDNLSELPNLDVIETDTINVDSVKYCMGIPSVENFTINLQRKYSNINSPYKFIPGDKVIGQVQSIKDVYWQSINFTSDPVESGEYTKNYISSNHYYTVSKNFPFSGTADNLDITESGYSLVGTTNVTNAISVYHYFDKSSFTGTDSLIPKVDLTDVYEIADSTELEKLSGPIPGGDDQGGLGYIQVANYSNHNILVKNHTLLYINGGFRTNASYNYPNVNNYTWNDKLSGDVYNSGESAFNTLGEQDNTNGYKWIVFRIDKTNQNYVKTATSKTGSGGAPYIDVPGLLNSKGLGSINPILGGESGFGNQDAIGFIRIFATRNGQEDGYQIGRFTSPANPSPNLIWYAGQNSITISLNTLLDQTTGNNYGAQIDTGNYHVDNLWGVECPSQPNFKRNEIDIFIGLKNSISLP